MLTLAISADNFTGALGGVAFIGYLSSLCTAGMAGTQYALLTSLMAFGRTTMSAGGGWLAAQMGWVEFWIATDAARHPWPAAAVVAWHVSAKENPSFREEGGAVNRLRGVIRAGGTGPFRSGAWGCRPGTGSSGLVPGRYKTVTASVEKADQPGVASRA